MLRRVTAILNLAGALCTSCMLAAAFPPVEIPALAWFALVPLFIVCFRTRPRDAFAYGFVSGLVFWLISIFWINMVSVAGWFGLSLYCALYFGMAAACISWAAGLHGTGSSYKNTSLLFLIPIIWTGFEYIRGNFATGFAWNYVGTSQYRSLPLIQCAEFGGVYLVSALVVMLNAGIALTVARYTSDGRIRFRPPHIELMLGFVVLAFVASAGLKLMRMDTGREVSVSVGVVQPNVPQVMKWDENFIQSIYTRLRNGTEALLEAGPVDMVVWPETAVPDFFRESLRSRTLVRNLAGAGMPVLIGSMDVEYAGDREVYYNSSILWYKGPSDRDNDDAGDEPAMWKYDKRHLVLFGEYVPFERYLPFLKALTPIDGSFAAGSTSTVFSLPGRDVGFSSLICFEDTVPELARDSVRNGARMLVNQTNDGWFDPSGASRQHMSHCVFRCVENRVPAVRCANTGVSCFIDAQGRIHGELPVASLSNGSPSFMRQNVMASAASMPLTVYTLYGDVFAASCAAFSVAVLVLCIVSERRKRRRKPAKL